MIDLYFWDTPNGYKIAIALEEMHLPYQLHFIDLKAGEQKKPGFAAISRNQKIPAIVDQDAQLAPLALSESGAILQYLGTKSGLYYPKDLRTRALVAQWLHWQMSGLGPMMGQAFHFKKFAPTPIPYAIDRYVGETRRLLGVLNHQLEGRPYIVDDYSIADMAAFPWARVAKVLEIDLAKEFPNVAAWVERNEKRPGTSRALAIKP